MNDDFNAALMAEVLGITNAIDAQSPAENAITRLTQAAEKGDAELGATARELLPLLCFGLMALGKGFADALEKKGKGRPKVNRFGDIDCRRAFLCWNAVRIVKGTTHTNRAALRIARLIETLANVPPEEAAFPKHVTDETLEQSVSRGKKKLGFTDAWTCQICEEILAIP